MNRFWLVSVFASIGFFASCGKDHISDPNPLPTDTLGTKDSVPVVPTALDIAGTWKVDTRVDYKGSRYAANGSLVALANGTIADTLKLFANLGGVIDNPYFATRRTWIANDSQVVVTKVECAARDNNGRWTPTVCDQPLADTIRGKAGTSLADIRIRLEGVGTLIYNKN